MKILSVVIFSLLVLTKAYGLDVKDLVVFGDSLSCNGNACLHSSNPPSICRFYPQGYFTDGKVWVELLAEKMKVAEPRPSLDGGLNFAYGSATTGWRKSPHVLNVGNQIKEFLKRTGNTANPDNLYIIWAGGNDIKNEIIPTELISNLEAHIRSLANAGARTFFVPNYPPLGKAPLVEGSLSLVGRSLGMLGEFLDLFDDGSCINKGLSSTASKAADIAIQFFNLQLETMLQNLEDSLDITIYRFDAYAHFNRVTKNRKDYGLKPNDRLFYIDGFHPSALGHKLIAEEAFKSIN